jgi:hypothetical protein
MHASQIHELRLCRVTEAAVLFDSVSNQSFNAADANGSKSEAGNPKSRHCRRPILRLTSSGTPQGMTSAAR